MKMVCIYVQFKPEIFDFVLFIEFNNCEEVAIYIATQKRLNTAKMKSLITTFSNFVQYVVIF